MRSRLQRIVKGPLHPLLERGVFCAHRDFDKWLDDYEAGRPVYLYTGRGPSSRAMHLGHLLPFRFNSWLSKTLGVPLCIQLTDDEKYFYQQNKKENKRKNKFQSLEEFTEMAYENIRDILAVGFDPQLTFIFINTEYMPWLYKNVVRMQRHITYNQVRSIFGLTGSENSGKVAYPAIQAAPCLPSSFEHIFGSRKDVRCCVPSAIDQDPYFRMTRDISARLGYLKPGVLQCKFIPALQGSGSKMSSSNPSGTIFLTDSPQQVKKKVNRAFSGGCSSLEEFRRKGANLQKDVAYTYLGYFMEDSLRYQ